MTTAKTNDETIRDNVESLVERGTEECLFFTGVSAIRSHPGLDEYFEETKSNDCYMTLMVHASSKSEAVMVVADNIVKNTAASEYPVTYRDIFGETPNDLDGTELEGIWCEFYDVSKAKHLK